MAWYRREKTARELPKKKTVTVPEGHWLKCPGCGATTHKEELEETDGVCPNCDHHLRINLAQRLELLQTDDFEPLYFGLEESDPLGFVDRIPYKERLERAKGDEPMREAVLVGRARWGELDFILGLFDFDFMGGTMGSVAGERIVRAIDAAAADGLPVVFFTASGGARMQEGLFSLVQMARISQALVKLKQAGSLLIIVACDPTTGGVNASLASAGDVILAEPGALIGFTGPKVIKETIGGEFPDDFQRAEFLLAHGMVDRVVHRRELADELRALLAILLGVNTAGEQSPA